MPSSAWPVQTDLSHLYFVTAKAVQGAHIFQRDVIKRILVDSLNVGRILGQYQLFVFVAMPNHVHFIVRCLDDYTVSDVVREFKKSTAGLVLRQYEAENNQQALAFLASVVEPGQEQRHAVWEDEYQAKDVYSPGFLRQKMDYIHDNPLQPNWHLVEQADRYVWSSARFYLDVGRALIPLSDARELLL